MTRVPVVRGRTPRAGTVAVALHATEPLAAGCGADIAVCAREEPSLRRAATALTRPRRVVGAVRAAQAG